MSEYYVFATEDEANACIGAINATNVFPVTGTCNGQPRPEAQKTEKWCESPLELNAGGFAVPRIPERLLDFASIPQADRDAFLTAFGQDIRDCQSCDFVRIDEM